MLLAVAENRRRWESSHPFVVTLAKHPKLDSNLASTEDKCPALWYALRTGNNHFVDALLSNNEGVNIDVKHQAQTMLQCT